MMDDIFRFAEHFRREELEKAGTRFHPKALFMLDMARSFYVAPIIVNRGADTEENNQKVGGDPSSLHVPQNGPDERATAVDIQRPNGNAMATLVQALFKAGFNRVIVYPDHIHAAWNPNKPEFLGWNDY